MIVKVRKGYQFFRANNLSVGGGATITDATEQEVSTQTWKVEILTDSPKKETIVLKKEVQEEAPVKEVETSKEEEEKEEEVEDTAEDEELESDNKGVDEAPKDRAIKKTKRKSRK